jgi:hypothetical protein
MEQHLLRRRAKEVQLSLMDALNDLPLQDVRTVLRDVSLGLAKVAFRLNASVPDLNAEENPFADE